MTMMKRRKIFLIFIMRFSGFISLGFGARYSSVAKRERQRIEMREEEQVGLDSLLQMKCNVITISKLSCMISYVLYVSICLGTLRGKDIICMHYYYITECNLKTNFENHRFLAISNNMVYKHPSFYKKTEKKV